MNKVLKFRQSDTQKVYVVSDFHYNHDPKWEVPIWKQRGFNSVQDMNVGIIDAVNSTVGENDILWNLGDITLNCTELQFEELISKIKCKNMYVLFGNHPNPCWKIYQRQVLEQFGLENVEVYPLRYKNVIFVGTEQEIIVDGQIIVLSHYPLYVFNHMKDMAWNLCGHSHYSLPFSQAGNDQSKILDVGFDGIKRPYSMSEIRDIMRHKKVLRVDHHV